VDLAVKVDLVEVVVQVDLAEPVEVVV